MLWGIHLPHLGRQVNARAIETFACEAERLGCHSVWVSDHVCWPNLSHIESKYPYAQDGEFLVSPDKDWLDAIGTLFFVASLTRTVKLATSVLILPYRPPVTTAKQIASLDVLSGGRVILGIGVGWMEEEARILGMPWNRRGRRSDEQLLAFRTLFEDPTPTFKGEFYQFENVGFEPKPLQRPLPVWVGGASQHAFERTAQFGQAFHAAFQPISEVAAAWSAIHAVCQRIGRDPSSLTLSLRVFLDPTASMPKEHSIAGKKDEMLSTIDALQQIGVSHILLDAVARGGPAARLDVIRAFMEDVAPHVSA